MAYDVFLVSAIEDRDMAKLVALDSDGANAA